MLKIITIIIRVTTIFRNTLPQPKTIATDPTCPLTVPYERFCPITAAAELDICCHKIDTKLRNESIPRIDATMYETGLEGNGFTSISLPASSTSVCEPGKVERRTNPIAMSGMDVNRQRNQQLQSQIGKGDCAHIRPLKTIWFMKFLAVQIRFNGSPAADLVSLMAPACLSALVEQSHGPADCRIHIPMYPALISKDAVSLEPTRSVNVAEMFGLTCVKSRRVEEELPLWYESDKRYTLLSRVSVQPASKIAGVVVRINSGRVFVSRSKKYVHRNITDMGIRNIIIW
ncbi:hypothetical protein GJ744_004932 [Endocarpon pusillum]|uniref:Uncharacterized protein n=1 Tax=Endocarpon pusillum TaxID=364733 RepID=A0A8H7A8G4_9EURO|nr:hypothetical protein GJ744_004932 [Endocarpon pusillum]